MNTAVGTDSSSGITPEQAKEMGIFLVPMPFIIDGQEYEAGITLSEEDFYRKMAEGADISTSQPSPERVKAAWEEALREYDEVVYIPLSSGLSSTLQTALILSQEYEGRVQVVNNQRVSVTQRQSVIDALELLREGESAVHVKEILEEEKFNSSIYVTMDTLKYLKKGGRITPAAAALGTLLKIKPVLQLQGEKLDAFSKVRTLKQARAAMLSALAHDLKTRFGDPEARHTWLEVAHTQNDVLAEEFAQEIRAAYPNARGIYIDPLSLNIACHTGPGALAVACSKQVRWKAE